MINEAYSTIGESVKDNESFTEHVVVISYTHEIVFEYEDYSIYQYEIIFVIREIVTNLRGDQIGIRNMPDPYYLHKN